MPQTAESPSTMRDGFLILACTVIILGGARYASNLLVPFLLSLLIAVICGSPISALKQRGVPGWIASTVVGVAMLVVLLLMIAFLGRAVTGFLAALPDYQTQFQALTAGWLGWLADRGVVMDAAAINDLLNPATALGFFGGFLSGLSDVVANFMLILFTVVFILADAPSIPGRLASGEDGSLHRYLSSFRGFAQAMNGYIVTKAKVSLLTGGLVWLGLSLLGADFALLWGFLAFLLNFIPNIGSIIAAVPPVLLSLLDMSLLHTGAIIGLYLAINVLVGNIIETRWMGQRVGLSTLAVFLSLVFWGWMFGPVGMLLSVPLTMSVKFLALQHPATHWLSALLSNNASAQAEEPAPPAADDAIADRERRAGHGLQPD